MEAHIRLQTSAHEDAEFYVVVQGSRLTHVTAAKRRHDGMTLGFTVPGRSFSGFNSIHQVSLFARHCLISSAVVFSPTGHDLAEVVSVTSYFYAEDQIKPCKGEAFLEYCRDSAQEVAEYLCTHRDQLGPQSHLEVVKRFLMRPQGADEELAGGLLDGIDEDVWPKQSSGDEAGLRQLDENITQAVANMDHPQPWKTSDREGNEIGSESVSHELQSYRFLSTLLQYLPLTDSF